MHIDAETRGRVTLLHLHGAIDAITAASVQEATLQALDAKPAGLVLDLGAVDYLSSAGLRVLLVLLKRAGTDGTALVLTGLTELVREVFEISGFITVFRLAPTVEDAVALAGGG